MSRRYNEPFFGSRYIGIQDKRIVHDMDYESEKCCLEEMLEIYKMIPFTPDTIEQAHMEGFNNCPYCLGGETKY